MRKQQKGTDKTMEQKLTDQVIANDMLIAAKSGVKTYASAVVESATPAVKDMMKKHLDDAITFQSKIGDFVMSKGWYDAYNLNKLLENDCKQSQCAINKIG
ncbi:MAG: spore coat protein [Eubacteriales bacterium]|jgi:similar to spore coat protein